MSSIIHRVLLSGLLSVLISCQAWGRIMPAQTFPCPTHSVWPRNKKMCSLWPTCRGGNSIVMKNSND